MGGLILPNEPQPGTDQLVDVHGRTWRKVTHINPAGHRMRLIPLDDNGRLSGHEVELPTDHIALLSEFTSECRWCGQQNGHAAGCPLASGG